MCQLIASHNYWLPSVIVIVVQLHMSTLFCKLFICAAQQRQHHQYIHCFAVKKILFIAVFTTDGLNNAGSSLFFFIFIHDINTFYCCNFFISTYTRVITAS